jgi:hypothetical protein
MESWRRQDLKRISRLAEDLHWIDAEPVLEH